MKSNICLKSVSYLVEVSVSETNPPPKKQTWSCRLNMQLHAEPEKSICESGLVSTLKGSSDVTETDLRAVCMKSWKQ